jgi:thioredoxin-like negative regulator of GroEL
VKVRTTLLLTALVSSILGAIVVYLVMTVPNDLQAGALLKEARANIAAGKSAEAHDALAKIVQQYPRTDAAAAATVALMKLEENERERIRAEITQLRTGHDQQSRAIAKLNTSVETLQKTPPPAPAPVAVAEPPKPVAKKAPAKKTPTKKTPTRRKR